MTAVGGGGTECAKSFGCQFRAGGLLYKQEGNFSCVAVAVADPKPSLVERLFTEHRAGLQTFFRRRIRSKADAPDLAQEVYVRMLRISDQEAIRNPVHYLYTVANNLVKEHAVLERRQASGIDIDEAPAQEQLQTLPAFDGELDTRQRVARLGRRAEAAASEMPHRCGPALHA